MANDLNRYISFLVERKFPTEVGRRNILGGPPTKTESSYEAELLAKPKDELMELYQQETELLQKEQLQEEAAATTEMFEHWRKAAYWTLDEAVFLMFHFEPSDVMQGKEQSMVQSAALIISRDQIERVRDLAHRAKNVGQLDDPVVPGDFLKWALTNNIDVPDELRAMFERETNDAEQNDLPEHCDAVYHMGVRVRYTRNLGTKPSLENALTILSLWPQARAALRKESSKTTKERIAAQVKTISAANGEPIPQDSKTITRWRSQLIQENPHLKKCLSDIFG